ncbi:MAG: dinitrogenase iron-molybdenum cofactor biosynthesis protein [Deltaproteobacteria bacterium]|uniref:dinitrogenase iron-molybdenum cofactor biosynthesis protein n=1 Tax=Hydrosulfovibrio ferrireducens TaxID=2934181 RepID=UPI00120A4D2E|nr:MAG: dinitrogenase iron-molybdenum cofactor biosynthesis protein [Deltaproteobacteria bacterium]
MTIIHFPKTKQGCCGKIPQWLILPMAPQAAARIRFCGEDKLPQAVPIRGALTWIADLLAQGNEIGGLDLHGPGDPLATPAMTTEILVMLREQYPDLPLGITTLGLGLAEHAGVLAEQGVARVTLLVDAVTPQTVKKIYTWIRPGKRNTPLAEAAEILIEAQAKGIAACKAAGIAVSIHTSVYGGVNDQEVEEIARQASALGADSISLLPGKGWLNTEAKLPLVSEETMATLAKKAAQHLSVVCLPEQAPPGESIAPVGEGLSVPKPTTDRPNVAVLSSNGMDIDLHLGQAIKALIYGPREDGLACLLGTRDLPEPGSGDNRWQQVAEILKDCFVLLAASAGQKPREILGRHGLAVLLLEDNVEGTVDVLYGGGKKGRNKK